MNFEETPTQSQIKIGINNLSGLNFIFEELGPDSVIIKHPLNEKMTIYIDWIRQGQNVAIGNTIFKNRIRIESEIGAISNNYTEATLIYLLKEMGGVTEDTFNLPKWAGQRWSDVPKNTIASWIRKFISI